MADGNGNANGFSETGYICIVGADMSRKRSSTHRTRLRRATSKQVPRPSRDVTKALTIVGTGQFTSADSLGTGTANHCGAPILSSAARNAGAPRRSTAGIADPAVSLSRVFSDVTRQLESTRLTAIATALRIWPVVLAHGRSESISRQSQSLPRSTAFVKPFRCTCSKTHPSK